MSKLKRAPRSQHKRFIEAARKAECSEDEAEFDRRIEKIIRAKPKKDNGA